MKLALRLTPRDAMAGVPLICFGVLMLYVWLAYREVGHWPLPYRPDPKDVGFEVWPGLRFGEILRLVVPLIGAPLSVVAVLGVFFSTLNDLADSSRSSRLQVGTRGFCQILVSVAGLLLFWHTFGTLLDWLID